MCSLVHVFTCTLEHLFTCWLVHLFTCWLVHLFTCTLVHLYICTLVHLYTCSLVHLSTCTLVFVHLFTCSKVYLYWGLRPIYIYMYIQLHKFMCDLNLETKWLIHAFCAVSWWANHLSQDFWKSFKEWRRYGADMKSRLKLSGVTLTLRQNGCTSVHHLSELNSWAKLIKTLQRM